MEKKFHVADMQGRIIVLSEKTSIILTLVFVLTIVSTIGFFGGAAYMMTQSIAASIPLIVGGFFSLIYAFIFNHLRKKGDMNVDKAVIPTTSGGSVEVTKKTSIWITLAYVIAIIGLIGAVGLTGYGAYVYATSGIGLETIIAGITGSIAMLLYIMVLGFLRTKIDFPLNNVVVRDTSGRLVELYKRKSAWLTLGMVLTILAGIIFILLGILAFTNTAFIQGYMTSQTTMTQYTGQPLSLGGLISASLVGAPAIIAGLVMFVGAAVLGFLRIRGHVREYTTPTM